jgi:hypothetical protein
MKKGVIVLRMASPVAMNSASRRRVTKKARVTCGAESE